jgi:biopolymer transport protein ExbD
MQFIKRRRHTAPTVIIVALIDILIVLLIFLLVTTTFKQQPSVKLTLPESKQPRQGANEQSAVIMIEIDKQAPFLRLDGRPVSLDRLQQELVNKARASAKSGVAIRADAQAPFEQVIKVMDTARQAGLTNFSAFVRSPGGQ